MPSIDFCADWQLSWSTNSSRRHTSNLSASGLTALGMASQAEKCRKQGPIPLHCDAVIGHLPSRMASASQPPFHAHLQENHISGRQRRFDNRTQRRSQSGLAAVKLGGRLPEETRETQPQRCSGETSICQRPESWRATTAAVTQVAERRSRADGRTRTRPKRVGKSGSSSEEVPDASKSSTSCLAQAMSRATSIPRKVLGKEVNAPIQSVLFDRVEIAEVTLTKAFHSRTRPACMSPL